MNSIILSISSSCDSIHFTYLFYDLAAISCYNRDVLLYIFTIFVVLSISVLGFFNFYYYLKYIFKCNMVYSFMMPTAQLFY